MSAPGPEHLCTHRPHCGPTNKPFTLIAMYIDVDIMVEMGSTCPFSKHSYVTFSCVNSLNERWISDWKYSYLLFLIPLQPDHHAINVNDVCRPLCIMDEPAFILSNAESMVVGVWPANGSATYSTSPAFCWILQDIKVGSRKRKVFLRFVKFLMRTKTELHWT